FRQATEIARRMVCNWGMSDAVGPVSYCEGEEHLFLGREVTRTKTHSEMLAIEIDREIKRIVDSSYMEAEKMIREHEVQTRRIAEALLKYESLSAEDVDKVMAGEDLGDRNHASAPKPPTASPT
ncbi:MAG: cell division protein FtsH, partial [Planctomycetes bacterium]|nr:cell division protein FtsH [Planctomycetota bacterium]